MQGLGTAAILCLAVAYVLRFVLEPGAAAPVIDIGPLFQDGVSSSSRKAVGEKLLQAAAVHGLVRVVGHGVNGKAVLDAGHRYFQLPEASRPSSRNVTTGFQRGFIPLAGESGLAEVLEVKEGFSYGHAWPGEELPPGHNALEGLNAWPPQADLPGWREDMESYYEDSVRVAKSVVASISLAIGEEAAHGSATALEQLCAGGETISQMRLFNYFPASHAPPELAPGKPRMGSSPHTDWHLVTVILRDVHSRLQYKPAGVNQSWSDVSGDRDGQELLLVFGDYLAAYAGGKLHSPVHRVLLPEDNTSLSFVLFFYPRYEARMPVQDVGRGVSQTSGERYNTLLDQVDQSALDRPFGEYLQAKWRKVLGNGAA
ncbi:unnamed protein product [Polarella glacialis]|uniref:Fe2OG dioxygenase domain-containing protein n=1 Tax=Polarella glacialis TaxID=89957 RepID=A0A813H7P6_POLGL|nr:unnamed protein product [Polarella glacialis]CAE8633614.1 unnamed protein product [Polarella glacialis]